MRHKDDACMDSMELLIVQIYRKVRKDIYDSIKNTQLQ